MTVTRITATDFEQRWRDAVDQRSTKFDVVSGPIAATIIRPGAVVLEAQNTLIEKVSLLLSLANEVEFGGEYEADLEALVYNEGLLRLQGSYATGTATFYALVAPSTDVVIPVGLPVRTAESVSEGATTFVTTESATLPSTANGASSYFNLQTQRYEVSVPIIAVTAGSKGVVAPNQVTFMARQVAGIDGVTNRTATVGGADEETNRDLIERYLLAIRGSQIGTAAGIARYARTDFGPDVTDVKAVGAANPLVSRAGAGGAAVDVFVLGTKATSAVTVGTYLGVGQVIPIELPPLIEVTNVASGSTSSFVEGVDYELVFDSSGLGGSVKAVDGIRFLAGATTLPAAAGAAVTIDYTYDQAIRDLQADSETPSHKVLGRDILFRRAVQQNVAITCRLTVISGFSSAIVLSAARQRILDFVNGLKLGGSGVGVEVADVIADTKRLSGVDNITFSRFSLVSDSSGVIADIQIEDNEYPRLSVADLDVQLT